MGVHMAKDALLGGGRGFWDFLRKQLNRQPLPLEEALGECQPGWSPGPMAACELCRAQAGPAWGQRPGPGEAGALSSIPLPHSLLLRPQCPQLTNQSRVPPDSLSTLKYSVQDWLGNLQHLEPNGNAGGLLKKSRTKWCQRCWNVSFFYFFHDVSLEFSLWFFICYLMPFQVKESEILHH